MIERFNRYIKDNDKYEEGIIKIDKSVRKQQTHISKIINDLRENGTEFDKCDHITKAPMFVNSSAVEGIQVADAIAYCTSRYKRNATKFKPYWNKIHGKFIKNDNKIKDYRIKEYP